MSAVPGLGAMALTCSCRDPPCPPPQCLAVLSPLVDGWDKAVVVRVVVVSVVVVRVVVVAAAALADWRWFAHHEVLVGVSFGRLDQCLAGATWSSPKDAFSRELLLRPRCSRRVVRAQ